MSNDRTRTDRLRLYPLRHGHVDYFAEGLTDFRAMPLTGEGETQACAAGRALRGLAFDAAFSSGLPRTRRTLALVGEANEAGLPDPVQRPASTSPTGPVG